MPQLDYDSLKTWLWDSANILRGSIDSSDFKNYIFGLLFLKRANDVFEEEVENLMQQDDCSRAEAEEATYFRVPVEARWDTVKQATENIGVALDKAFAAIERENPEQHLEGVMTATKFGDKEKLTDATLQRLLRHFNRHSLPQRRPLYPRPAGRCLLIPHQAVCRRRGQEGRRVVHPVRGGAAGFTPALARR